MPMQRVRESSCYPIAHRLIPWEAANDILGTNAPGAVADQILQAVLPLRRITGKQAPPNRLATGAGLCCPRGV